MYFPIANSGVYAHGWVSKLRVVGCVFFLYIRLYAVCFCANRVVASAVCIGFFISRTAR